MVSGTQIPAAVLIEYTKGKIVTKSAKFGMVVLWGMGS